MEGAMSKAINKLLVEKGYELFNRPKEFVEFTANKKANSLLNDLDNTPHAFVLACIMDRQIDAKLAWIIPYKLKDRIQKFDFLTLSKLSKDEIHQHFITPDNLHRFPDVMSNNFFSAIRHIETKYNGDA